MDHDSIIYGYRHQDDRPEEPPFLAGHSDLGGLDFDLVGDAIQPVRAVTATKPRRRPSKKWETVRYVAKLAAVYLTFFFIGLGIGRWEATVRLGYVIETKGQIVYELGSALVDRELRLRQRDNWIAQAQDYIQYLEDRLEKFNKVNLTQR